MTVEDFIKNLSGVDGGKDFDGKLLRSIYKSIKKQQFVGGADHVIQTQHLQQRIVQSNNTSAGKLVFSNLDSFSIILFCEKASLKMLMLYFVFKEKEYLLLLPISLNPIGD